MVREIALEEGISKPAAGKTFIETRSDPEDNYLIQTHHPNKSLCTEFTRIHIPLGLKAKSEGIKRTLAADCEDNCKLKRNTRCEIQQREFCLCRSSHRSLFLQFTEAEPERKVIFLRQEECTSINTAHCC